MQPFRLMIIFFMMTFYAPLLAAGDFMIDFEAGGVYPGYNDVQIPSDSGTRFSLKDDVASSPAPYMRLKGGYDFSSRHSLFILYAPLTVKGEGRLRSDINFSGETFPAGTKVKSTFRFDSYRLTYLYTFMKDGMFALRGGITGKIRDAEITLRDSSREATKSNTGFVPLIHVQAQWFAAPGISLLLDGDGLAAPQGRAEDFLLAVQYHAGPGWTFRLGYRILEGGSDGGGKVYTFSLFHYFGAGVTFMF